MLVSVYPSPGIKPLVYYEIFSEALSKVFPTTSALDDEVIKQISIVFKIFFTELLIIFN